MVDATLKRNRRQAEALKLVTLHPDTVVDSMWGSFLQAGDGNIYIAAGNHETFNGDVWLFQVNPDTLQSSVVMSLAHTLGTRAAQSAVGESKVHTRLYQHSDGLIYFGTMQGGIGHVSKWNHYSHPSQYEGGHLFCYDPSTRRGWDLGVPVKYEGLQTQVLDSERNILYFVTWPKKLFVSYNIDSRVTKVHGVLAWSPTRPDGKRLYLGRDIMISNGGIVYFINNEGCLSKFDPEIGKIIDTNIFVNAGDSLRAHVRAEDGTIYFVTSLGYLFALDPLSERVESLGAVLPDRAGYTPNLGLTRDQKKLVYMAASHASYSGDAIPLVEFDLSSRSYAVLGEFDADFFPISCFGTVIDDRDRYLFAIHGQEPSNSFLAVYNPKHPADSSWLQPEGAKKVPVFEMEKQGSEGKTKGWIVADYLELADADGKKIENGRSRITSLHSHIDGRIYGATSAGPGEGSFLFSYLPGDESITIHRDLQALEVPAQMVCKGLVGGRDGALYGGVIDLHWDRFTEPRNSWRLAPALPEGYPGGFLFRYDPSSDEFSILGTPVPGQGIYSMCTDPEAEKIYALTYPHATLVCWDISSKELTTVGQVYDQNTDGLRPDEFDLAAVPIVSEVEYRERLDSLAARRGMDTASGLDYYTICRKYYVSRAIACDAQGRVYGSCGEGNLFQYNPDSGRIERLPAQIPLVNGTDYGLIAETSTESLLRSKNGLLYGGTCQDGYLFSFDPATGLVRNLGKPVIEGRIRDLCEWRGAIYGIVGEDLGKVHLFRYEEKGAGIVDLGVLQGGGKTGFAVNICDTIESGSDGRLYIGQSERISCLLSLDTIEYEPHQSP